MIKPLYTSLFFSLSYDDTSDWLQAEWQGTHDATSSLASCALIMQHAQALHCRRLLCDSSLAYDGWDEIGQWVSTQYLPQLAETGVTYIAWIVAPDWAASKAIISFIQQSEEPYISVFTEGLGAYDWLTRQPTKPRDPNRPIPPFSLT